jgi:hypothetical protein
MLSEKELLKLEKLETKLYNRNVLTVNTFIKSPMYKTYVNSL